MALKIKIILVGLLLSVSSFSQEINWTQFEDLNDSLRNAPKGVLIFIHTDWCKYCKMQENTTFRDSTVIHYLNANYYCLRLDAELEKELVFSGKTYQKFNSDYHELVVFLATENQKISFPTTVVFNSNLELKNRLIGLAVKEDFIE